MNIIAQKLRDHLFSVYRTAIWPIYDNYGRHRRWLEIKPGHDWFDFNKHGWQQANHPVGTLFLLVGGVALLLFALFAKDTGWLEITGGVLVLVTAVASVSMETQFIQDKLPRLKKVDHIERILAGDYDTSAIYQHAVFPFNLIFLRPISTRLEAAVLLVSMNLDWYSAPPRPLLRWTWVVIVASLVYGIVALLQRAQLIGEYSEFIVFTGTVFPIYQAYAMCSWRRRILLGIVISHLERDYLGVAGEDEQRRDD